MDVINYFDKTGEIPDVFIEQIRTEYIKRKTLYHYFKNNDNRLFCVCLLKKLIELRKNPEEDVLIEDLMFASYLLGRHGYIEDAMLIWLAKSVDFDSYCGMDSQLIAFAGKEATITFFERSTLPESQKALKYLTQWADLNNLHHYFETIEDQYWIGDNI